MGKPRDERGPATSLNDHPHGRRPQQEPRPDASITVKTDGAILG